MFGQGGWHNPGDPVEKLREYRRNRGPNSRAGAKKLLEERFGDLLAPARRSDLLAAVYGRQRTKRASQDMDRPATYSSAKVRRSAGLEVNITTPVDTPHDAPAALAASACSSSGTLVKTEMPSAAHVDEPSRCLNSAKTNSSAVVSYDGSTWRSYGIQKEGYWYNDSPDLDYYRTEFPVTGPGRH